VGAGHDKISVITDSKGPNLTMMTFKFLDIFKLGRLNQTSREGLSIESYLVTIPVF
jgi:hypothetical protein